MDALSDTHPVTQPAEQSKEDFFQSRRSKRETLEDAQNRAEKEARGSNGRAHVSQLVQLKNEFAIGIGSQSSFVDLVHVLANCGSELQRVDGAAKAPQVDGILGIDNDPEARANVGICPQDGASCLRLDRHCSIERHGWPIYRTP
jgi:hypothetical protein